VKLEFPSGVEVLFTPTGFLHLRSGEQAGRFNNGVELLLADGSNLRVHLQDHRLRRVDVRCGNRSILLWDRKRPVRQLVRKRVTAGPQILVLGEGDLFYRAVLMGPLIAMERVLCTEKARPVLPQRHLVILAEPLIESLRQLPRKFARPSVDYPDATGISLVLSQMAQEIFGNEVSPLRRAEAKFLRMTLDSGFELSLHLPEVGPLLLSLHRGAEARTLVEWTIGTSTALRMVRPDGGSAAAPRYYRGGIRLDEGFDLVTALRRDFAEQKRGRAILRAMGAVPRNTALAPKPGG
jgi:hypothetical protein